MIRKKILYIYLALLGVFLITVIYNNEQKTIAFYGIAENNSIPINYNLPVYINEIYVKPGEYVNEGTPLLSVTIVKTEYELETSNFEIEKTKAEAENLKKVNLSEINRLKIEKELALTNINDEISRLEIDLNYKKQLSEQLTSIDFETDSQISLQERLLTLKNKKALLQKKYTTLINSLTAKSDFGTLPFTKQINKLSAEIDFDEKMSSQQIVISAPANGIVSTLICKKKTFIPAFQTLMDFHEPNPKIVKGFVHENEIVGLENGDIIKISSSANESLFYEGKVIGMGSRITEIPERLRKFPTIKHYGREIEVLIIDKNNKLLQEEKVALQLVPSSGLKKITTLATSEN